MNLSGLDERLFNVSHFDEVFTSFLSLHAEFSTILACAADRGQSAECLQSKTLCQESLQRLQLGSQLGHDSIVSCWDLFIAHSNCSS